MLTRIKQYFPILTLTAAHGAVDFYVGLLAVVAPGLAQYLGLTLGDIVFLVGAANLLNNICQPLTGWVMGKRNVAWILSLAVILASLPTFMGFATGLYSLALLVLLGSIGTGVYHPEAALSAHDEAGDNSHMGIPLFMAGGAAIYAAGTPLSIKWTEWFGFPALAWFALPGIVAGLILYFQYRDKKRKHPSIVLRPRSRRITQMSEGQMSYWPLLAVAICYGVANGLFISTLSSHYELMFGPSARVWAGWVLMGWGIAGSLASFLWAAKAARKGFYLLTLVTQALAVPLFLFMAWPTSPQAGFLISIPLAIISPGAVYPVAVSMARNAAGLTQALRTSLLMGGTSGLSSIAVMLAGGMLRNGMPSSHLLVFSAGCSLLAVLLAVWQLIVNRNLKKPA